MQTGHRFHHLGIAVRDMDGAIESYAQMLGLRLLGPPVDDPIQRVRVCFLGSDAPGEIVYELVTPLVAGEKSPIDRVLEKGNTSYHVCYEVPGLERAIADLVAAGCYVIAEPVPAVAFAGRRIAWLMTGTRHLIELLEATTP